MFLDGIAIALVLFVVQEWTLGMIHGCWVRVKDFPPETGSKLLKGMGYKLLTYFLFGMGLSWSLHHFHLLH